MDTPRIEADKGQGPRKAPVGPSTSTQGPAPELNGPAIKARGSRPARIAITQFLAQQDPQYRGDGNA